MEIYPAQVHNINFITSAIIQDIVNSRSIPDGSNSESNLLRIKIVSYKMEFGNDYEWCSFVFQDTVVGTTSTGQKVYAPDFMSYEKGYGNPNKFGVEPKPVDKELIGSFMDSKVESTYIDMEIKWVSKKLSSDIVELYLPSRVQSDFIETYNLIKDSIKSVKNIKFKFTDFYDPDLGDKLNSALENVRSKPKALWDQYTSQKQKIYEDKSISEEDQDKQLEEAKKNYDKNLNEVKRQESELRVALTKYQLADKLVAGTKDGPQKINNYFSHLKEAFDQYASNEATIFDNNLSSSGKSEEQALTVQMNEDEERNRQEQEMEQQDFDQTMDEDDLEDLIG